MLSAATGWAAIAAIIPTAHRRAALITHPVTGTCSNLSACSIKDTIPLSAREHEQFSRSVAGRRKRERVQLHSSCVEIVKRAQDIALIAIMAMPAR
jgi:hypothetical protein